MHAVPLLRCWVYLGTVTANILIVFELVEKLEEEGGGAEVFGMIASYLLLRLCKNM